MTEPDHTPVPDADYGAAARQRRTWVIGGAIGSAALFAAIAGGVAWYSMSDRLEEACSSVLEVINPKGATFDRLFSDVNSGSRTVRMLFNVVRPGETVRRSVIVCSFAPGTVLASIKPGLVAASIDGHTIGPARLAFLNRFWFRKGAQSG